MKKTSEKNKFTAKIKTCINLKSHIHKELERLSEIIIKEKYQ